MFHSNCDIHSPDYNLQAYFQPFGVEKTLLIVTFRMLKIFWQFVIKYLGDNLPQILPWKHHWNERVLAEEVSSLFCSLVSTDSVHFSNWTFSLPASPAFSPLCLLPHYHLPHKSLTVAQPLFSNLFFFCFNEAWCHINSTLFSHKCVPSRDMDVFLYGQGVLEDVEVDVIRCLKCT